MRHGTCFHRRLSTHRAGAAPHSAVAELGVVRRYRTSPVNLNYLFLYSLGVAVLAVVCGNAFSRRLGLPYLLTSILWLGTSIIIAAVTVTLAQFYLGDAEDRAIPWIEHLGISLGVLSVGSALACFYFFVAACVCGIGQAFTRQVRNQ